MTQPRPSSYLPTSPNFFTSRPVSSIVSGVVPSNPVLSTGWSSSTALRPSRTISSTMTAPAVTPISASCVATKNITLDFDNLPVAVHNRESPSIPSPYQHFFFSKGWIYGTSATVTYAQFPASSGNSMAAYIPSLSPNGSAPGSFGIFTNDTEIAHGFNIHSLRFGCNGLGASKNEICRVLVTGIPVDAHVKRHAIEIDIEPCMFADGCALAIIDFGENMFPALKAMQFRASIANKTVGWFIDDIEMGLNVKCANETGNAEPSPNYDPRRGVVRRRSVAYEPFKLSRKNRK
ncbi:hypothetical protein KEM56_002702 [Ascosphaera pollenicola]|nr:hypothetical protein KEM56_002702 [Ascosphaera pollenicola]